MENQSKPKGEAEQLPPCPFCRGTATGHISLAPRPVCSIVCNKCEASTGVCRSPNEALEAWARRDDKAERLDAVIESAERKKDRAEGLMGLNQGRYIEGYARGLRNCAIELTEIAKGEPSVAEKAVQGLQECAKKLESETDDLF